MLFKGFKIMTKADNPTLPMGKSIDIESWLERDEGMITEPDILEIRLNSFMR